MKETKCYCGHTIYCDCGPEILEEAQKQQFNYDNLHDAKEISSRIKVVKTIEEAVIGLAQLLKDDPEFFIQEPKQETLEEAAERLFGKLETGIGADRRKIWLDGAKWQQEQDKNKYSEEEVLEIFDDWNKFDYRQESFSGKDDLTFKQWFEQFKKK